MSTEVLQQTEFDYETIAEADRAQIRHYARFIRRQEMKLVETVIAIGEALADTKARIGHGRFGDWIAAEFTNWSSDSAQRYMRIYETHKQKPQIAEFGISALHELLRPSVPVAALDEAIEAQAVEPVTVAKAKEIAEKHKPPKKPKAKPAPVVVQDEADESEETDGESWEPMEEPPLPKGETVFTELRRVFDSMSPLQRVTAGGMWRNWCDPE